MPSVVKMMAVAAAILFVSGIFVLVTGPELVHSQNSGGSFQSPSMPASLPRNIVNISITPNEPLIVSPGSSVSFTVTLTSLVNRTISFDNLSPLDTPAAMHLSFTQPSIALSPHSSGSFRITVSVQSDIAPGTYLIGYNIGQIAVHRAVIVS